MILKLGNKNESVKHLQEILNFLQGSNLLVDGHFGDKTKTEVVLFQKTNGLSIDGVIGRNSLRTVRELLQKAYNFVVFLDEGHGSIYKGRYSTFDKYRGKFKEFEGVLFKHWDEYPNMFCEGVFNRIVGTKLETAIKKQGIQVVKVGRDWDNKLENRVYLAERHIHQTDCSGLFLSQHSNAGSGGIAEGIIAFTTRGENYSDECSQHILSELDKKDVFKRMWLHTRINRALPYVWNKNRKDYFDTSSDHERNFRVIFGMDQQPSRNRVGAVLMEYGFFDNLKDAKFISREDVINEYVDALTKAIVTIQDNVNRKISILANYFKTP